MKPTATLATLRPDLGGSLETFNLAADQAEFIGMRALPVLDVALQASPFGKIPVKELLQHPETSRAPGSAYARRNWKFTTDSYACQEHGLEEPVDDREAKIYANYFDAEVVSAMRALDGVLRSAEERIAALIFNATTFTSYKTSVTNEWDDFTNATPITDVHNAVKSVRSQSGLWANALIVSRSVFLNLRQCAQIVDRIASSGAGESTLPGRITIAQLAQAFDLPIILVAGGTENTANEGATAAFGDIWGGEYAMVARLCTSKDIREPGLGRTFHWADDGSSIGGTVESYRDETIRGDVIRVRHDTHEKLLMTEAGHLLYNITT